jgi:hypothetical protein
MCGLLLLASAVVQAAPDVAPKRVLLLHSYGQDFAPYSDLAPNFRDELTRRLGDPVDLVDLAARRPPLTRLSRRPPKTIGPARPCGLAGP